MKAIVFLRGAVLIAASFPIGVIATTTPGNLYPSHSASMPPLDVRALPHARCPQNYKLEFVQLRWVRCSLANKSMPALPRFVAPVCDAGFALQDAAASNAPERNLYRCVKKS